MLRSADHEVVARDGYLVGQCSTIEVRARSQAAALTCSPAVLSARPASGFTNFRTKALGRTPIGAQFFWEPIGDVR